MELLGKCISFKAGQCPCLCCAQNIIGLTFGGLCSSRMNAVLRFNTKVIRDYRGSAKIPGQAVSEAEQNSLRNKVKKLLGQAVKAKTPDADDGERVRLSNEL